LFALSSSGPAINLGAEADIYIDSFWLQTRTCQKEGRENFKIFSKLTVFLAVLGFELRSGQASRPNFSFLISRKNMEVSITPSPVKWMGIKWLK
jgi:hypothetical protein